MSCIHCVNWMRQMSSVTRNSCNLIKRSIWYTVTQEFWKNSRANLNSGMLTFHVFEFYHPSNTASHNNLLQTPSQMLSCLKENNPFHSKRKKPTNFEEGDSEWNRKGNYAVMFYHLKFLGFFQVDHHLSENTYCNKKRHRGRQWDTRCTEEFVYEDTLNKPCGSRDYRETLSSLLHFIQT